MTHPIKTLRGQEFDENDLIDFQRWLTSPEAGKFMAMQKSDEERILNLLLAGVSDSKPVANYSLIQERRIGRLEKIQDVKALSVEVDEALKEFREEKPTA